MRCTSPCSNEDLDRIGCRVERILGTSKFIVVKEMARRPSREGSTEVDRSYERADSAATQVTHFRQELKQAIGEEGELDVAHLRSILGEAVRTISAAGYPRAEVRLAQSERASVAIRFADLILAAQTWISWTKLPPG
jgi:hypothetical protein